MKIILFLLLICSAHAQNLEEFSQKLNKELPQNYDHITRLQRTTVENNNFYYHFIVGVTQEEHDRVNPKVKAQILKTICSKPREKALLKNYKANIVYKYENDKGQSLGEFMVKPDHCK